jgi:poly-gamma-glutamate synthase PgsB/CapB
MTEISDWIQSQADYFVSLRQNGQLALAIFLVGFAVVFFAGAYRQRARIARARARIPLTIGGWGTRGKSGTERLKAAVFHGLGYEVSVKTTGCEAMLIHSVPEEPPHEIFIFRSFDKSTIWEQRDIVETAAALGSEVFLWECMALQPEFVELLQHDWMNDNFVTLTNAFPDHEDVQGPAGVDVANCITSFIPYDSTLLTTEVQFLPLFAQRARERGSVMHAVPPRAGDLIAEDLLALFPYSEHPRNIALVAKLSEELGIDRHLAMATMAEHVVPDLGVLKTYPPACVRGRVLRFINGMSANERTGFLNNWTRTQLCDKDADAQPHETVVTVVNNRWDRVARSEVFGRITVEDAVADAHVLIGTNLRGLRQYIDDALRRYCATIEVVVAEDLTSPNGADRARERLARLLARARVPAPLPDRILARIDVYAAGAGLALAAEHRAAVAQAAARLCQPPPDAPLELSRVRAEAAALLGPLEQALAAPPGRVPPGPEVLAPTDAADVAHHALRQAARIAVHARLRTQLDALFAGGRAARGDAASRAAAFNKLVAGVYRELYEELIVVVEDPGESGDQIIDRCARAVPPGTDVSVMGIQNIKGTGLDFVYRWLALDQTMARLKRLDAAEPAARIAALRELESFEDYGLVDTAIAAIVLGDHARRSLGEEEALYTRNALERVRGIHEERKRALEQAAQADLWGRIIGQVERLIDPLDSIRRRSRSRSVMRDLIDHRISHGRAAKEMRALYDRQGGGWLWRK